MSSPDERLLSHIPYYSYVGLHGRIGTGITATRYSQTRGPSIHLVDCGNANLNTKDAPHSPLCDVGNASDMDARRHRIKDQQITCRISRRRGIRGFNGVGSDQGAGALWLAL